MSPRTLRRGDAYTTTVYTPHPSQNQRRRAGTDYDQRLEPYTTLYLTASRLTGAPRRAVQFPFFGDETTRHRGPATDRRFRRRRDRPRRPAAHLRAVAPAARGHPHARGLRRARAQLPRPAVVHLQRAAAGVRAHARRLPVRRQAGLLPAVRGRDGAAAADGGHPRARRPPASPPARPTPRPASTSCATTTRTPGSRSTTRASAGSRSTRPPPPRPRAASRRTPPPTRASAPAVRRPSATRSPSAARRSRPARRARPWWRWPALVVALLAAFAAGFLGVRRHRRGAPPAMSELERALKRTRRELAPGTTLHALELRFAETPAAAGYVRALRESRYRDEPSHPTRAQRRGPAVRARTRPRGPRPPARVVGAPSPIGRFAASAAGLQLR